MSQDFWESRYQAGDMPWEKGAPSPGLVDFLAAHPELARGTVCVPGCGTGHDARSWARAGFQAFGCDIAPSAIRLATRRTRSAKQAHLDTAPEIPATELPLRHEMEERAGERRHVWVEAGTAFHQIGPPSPRPSPAPSSREREKTSGAVRGCARARLSAQFQVADFLQATPPFLFDWVFEHTMFCAIQPRERDDYVRALLRWLKPGGQYLAVNYLIPDRDGPPFGTTRDELWQRFSPHFELLQEWVPRSYPNRTGLELMLWWHRKG